MNTHNKTFAIGLVFLTALVMLALVGGFAYAQGAGPGQTEQVQPQGVSAVAPGAIPIQGRLTNASGSPLTGTYSVMFRLYESEVGGTAVCTDTRSVSVVNGLFSDYMDHCYTDINGQKLWLGVKVESDAEMTPRQVLMPVPYALSLVPDATISGTTGSGRPILHLENWATEGRGLRSYAMATTSENYGVVGVSRSPAGYGGYFYNNDGGVGLYGKGNPGVIGEGYGSFGSHGVVGRAGAFAAGIKGEGNITAYGGWFTSTDFVALYVTSNREDNTDALVVDGAQDGGIDFNVTTDGDVKQALASNGLVKAGVNAHCGSGPGITTRSFNNVGGTIVVTGTAAGQCTINLGFNVYDRFFVATSQSSAARFVSCYTSISSKNELYCRNWDAAGVNQDGSIMLLVY
jgi:hypothetical protein